MSFENVKLNDGNEIPAIAFGTGSVHKRHDITEYVAQALEAGFSHIDTAQYYDNESSVRRAIRESGLARSELYVTTKYGFGPIQHSVRSSLAELGLKYVDLYLIHSPQAIGTDVEGAWREFERIKEDGLARSIGVSNYNLEQLQAIMKIARIPPVVNQISLNPYNYVENKALLEYSHKHGIVIEAYSSLAPITKYPGGPVDVPVKAAAKRRGATPDQIIMAWVRAKGAVVVTTSTKKDRLLEYLAAGDIDPLTESEIAAIDEASTRGPPRPTSMKPVVAKRVVLCILGFALYELYRLMNYGLTWKTESRDS